MRISDWSSDVCSSDLRDPVTQHRAGRRDRRRGAERDPAGGRERDRPPCRLAVSERRVGVGGKCGGRKPDQDGLKRRTGRHGPLPQIGRAAGRERDSYYAATSVGAVSLKKKKKT